MPALRAVIFDLDDTLYPERAYVRSGFEAVAQWAEVNLSLPADEVLHEMEELFTQGVRGNTFDQWAIARGLSVEQVVPQMVATYRDHDPQIALHADVLPLLVLLRTSYRLGLLSDGLVGTQTRKLNALGLNGTFDAVVLSDSLGRDAWKPSPKPFIRVLADLAVDGQESVYVSDNPVKDFMGAREARMWTVRVRRPDGIYAGVEPESEAHAAHVEVADLRGFEAVLRTLAL